MDARVAAARAIAVQLGRMIDQADRVGMSDLGDLLEQARIAAESEARD
jgi:hypothetical protein